MFLDSQAPGDKMHRSQMTKMPPGSPWMPLGYTRLHDLNRTGMHQFAPGPANFLDGKIG